MFSAALAVVVSGLLALWYSPDVITAIYTVASAPSALHVQSKLALKQPQREALHQMLLFSLAVVDAAALTACRLFTEARQFTASDSDGSYMLEAPISPTLAAIRVPVSIAVAAPIVYFAFR